MVITINHMVMVTIINRMATVMVIHQIAIKTMAMVIINNHTIMDETCQDHNNVTNEISRRNNKLKMSYFFLSE